jgi:uncharacterized protein with HEPN domain
VSSKRYEPDDPKQKLQDIAERFALIREFLEGMSRERFLNDKKTNHAVAKVVEELCEAAYWFAKSESGRAVREKYPDVSFRVFGDAGNIIRHQYWWTDYGRLWDDLHEGADVAALEDLLENELPFYRRAFVKNTRR